jgi:hypothetical protein
MAITNAQQFKQLVNPPMKGKKRPGYRGDAAARSTGAQQSGRADPGKRGDPGEGANRVGFIAPTKDEPAFTSRDRFVTVDSDRVAENRRMVQESTGIAALDRLEKEGVKKSKFPGMFGTALNILGPLRNIGLRKNIEYFKKNFKGPFTLENYKQFMADRMDQVTSEGNEDNNIIFPLPMMAQAPSITDQETNMTDTNVTENQDALFRRFRADGGIMGGLADGNFDFESARQMYGLGKLVKKVTKTVKKIAKSPVGKAALLYAGGSYLSGMGAFGGLKGAGALSKAKLFGTALPGPLGREAFMGMAGKQGSLGLLGKLGLTKGAGSMALTGKGIASIIGTASLLPLLGLGTGDESEEEAEELIRGAGLDINAIRANPNQFLARRFRAEGGSMKEPVAKKTMPLLDMGGKEMDLRAEGGFVPIGRMEKADDVPARLSKNEFVFTADAVRNAGDGNVDKGAEVMYNMMKNLEAGGDVSEESQGLEGARKMFQTSQRLEEVL